MNFKLMNILFIVYFITQAFSSIKILDNGQFIFLKILISFFILFYYFLMNKIKPQLQLFYIMLFSFIVMIINVEVFFRLWVFFIFIHILSRMDREDIYKIFYFIAIFNILFLSIDILLVDLGFIEDIVYMERHSMGFKNANFFTMLAFSSFTIFVFFKKWVEIFISFIFLAITSFLYTGTRTPLLAIVLSLVFCLILFLSHKLKLKKQIIAFYGTFIIFLIILLPYIILFNIEFLLMNYPALDILLSFRLTLLNDTMKDVTLFNILFGGFNFKEDSFYTKILLDYGIIITFIIIYNFLVKIYKEIIYEHYNNIFLITIFVVSGITEQLFNPSIVFTLIVFILLFQPNLNRKEFLNVKK